MINLTVIRRKKAAFAYEFVFSDVLSKAEASDFIREVLFVSKVEWRGRSSVCRGELVGVSGQHDLKRHLEFPQGQDTE